MSVLCNIAYTYPDHSHLRTHKCLVYVKSNLSRHPLTCVEAGADGDSDLTLLVGGGECDVIVSPAGQTRDITVVLLGGAGDCLTLHPIGRKGIVVGSISVAPGQQGGAIVHTVHLGLHTAGETWGWGGDRGQGVSRGLLLKTGV